MMTAEQLKDSILLLAMQGKLETNSSTDVPIASVLRKIYAGKGRINPIDPDQIPYDIPENWKWARLEDITDNCDNPFADGPFGSNLKREHYTEKHEVRIIQLSNIGENGWRDTNEKYTTYEHLKTIERSKVNAGDIVIAKMMPAGRAIEVPMNDYAYVLSSDAVKFVAHPLLNKRFLLMAINSPVFREQVYSEVHGVTRVRTSLKKLKSYIVPLPPLAEQKRIVAKIEELMPFVEQYEAASTKLSTLNASFPEMMKKSILQEAVQGKLVPQDPNDEPASLLLKKITEEKKRLIKGGKIKKQKPLPAISEEEIPFDIPESWEWVRLGMIATKITDGSHNPPPKKNRGYRVISAKNVKKGHIVPQDDDRFTDQIGFEKENPRTKIKKGDIILGIIGGSIGNTALFNLEEPVIAQRSVAIIDSLVKNQYLKIVIESPFIQNYFKIKASGTAQGGVYLGELERLLIPLPPLNEQDRIIEQLKKVVPIMDAIK